MIEVEKVRKNARILAAFGIDHVIMFTFVFDGKVLSIVTGWFFQIGGWLYFRCFE